MLCYDGSMAAGTAIDCAGTLLPGAYARIAHLWVPPFASDAVRRRLWQGKRHLNEFVAAIEREGAAEADRLVTTGVVLARAAGWEAEPLVERSFGGEGLHLAELAEKLSPDLIVLGSRGLGGARAVLGSVSDIVVHYAPAPVLVIPHPLLTAERAALAGGPIVVGWDGSVGSRRALAAAEHLFGVRKIVLATVTGDGPTEPAPSGYDSVTREPRHRYPAGGRAVAEALCATAAEQRAAAVVVGSRGRSAAREILLGSVAMAALHHVPRPVVVVPLRSPDLPD
ncbi:universal stress protein [Paractinoplanes rishiriensis]|nr:universal stress protein [Actinoplanes rishiriensis]